MKRVCFVATVTLFSFTALNSQETTASVFAGYGTQGVVLRVDYKIPDVYIGESKTAVYLEGGLDQQKFSQENFTFNGDNYPSDSRVLFAGIGLTQIIEKKNLVVAPYAGLRYCYARFKDKALVDAIGEQTLIRYWNGTQVGPTVKNGYGNTFTFDIGTRFGVKVGKMVEIAISGGISPIKFSTAATVYGKHWGESPYPNDFYIDYPIWRAEGGLRFNF